ncbi:hypothetical protein D9M72_359950 [compost metagenome]
MVITIPVGTVALLAMVVPGAPARPIWRRTSRAAASVRPGRSSGILTALGPSEMFRVTFESGSMAVPAAGTVPMAVPLVMVSCGNLVICGLSLALYNR